MKTYNNKYQKWYDQIIDRTRNRTIEGYVERHHIVPKSLGGTDEESNLVALTAREHLIAHMLLPRFAENKKPMWLALWCMVHMGEVKLTGRLYEQVKIEISAALKGRKFSPEHIANLSAAKKGRKMSPETCAKMSAARKGRKMSPETCAAKKGRKKSPEHIAKMSAALKGRKLSPEHIAKMSAAKKGKKKSPETIAKRQATRAANRIAKQAAGIDHPLKGRKLSPETIAKREATRAANRALKPFQYSSECYHQSPVQLT